MARQSVYPTRTISERMPNARDARAPGGASASASAKTAINSFVRRRCRWRHGFVFISDEELEEQGITGPFMVGYELLYNGVPYLLCGLSIHGVLMQKRGGS